MLKTYVLIYYTNVRSLYIQQKENNTLQKRVFARIFQFFYIHKYEIFFHHSTYT